MVASSAEAAELRMTQGRRLKKDTTNFYRTAPPIGYTNSNVRAKAILR